MLTEPNFTAEDAQMFLIIIAPTSTRSSSTMLTCMPHAFASKISFSTTLLSHCESFSRFNYINASVSRAALSRKWLKMVISLILLIRAFNGLL